MRTYIVRVEFVTEIEAEDEEEATETAMRAATENGFQVTCEEKPVEHEDVHTDTGFYEASADEAIMRRLKSER